MEVPESNGGGSSLDHGIDSHPRHDKARPFNSLKKLFVARRLEKYGNLFAEIEAERRHNNYMRNIEMLIGFAPTGSVWTDIRAADNMTALETEGTEGSHRIDIDAGGFQNNDFASSATQPATVSYAANGGSEGGSAHLVGRQFSGGSLLLLPCQRSEKDLLNVEYFKSKSPALYPLEFPPRSSKLIDISRFTAAKVLNIMNKLETQGKQGSHRIDTGSVIQEPNNKLSAWTIPMIILSIVDGSIFTLLATASQDPGIGGLMSKYWSRIILGILTLSLTCSFLVRVFYKKLPAKFAKPASYLAVASNGAAFFLAAATYMGAI